MTLTNDQIRDLCRRRDVGIVAASAATQPAAAALVAAVTPEDLQTLVEDGTAARNRLVEANTGLVGFIVNRTVHGSRHGQDYMQEGVVALIDAVDRFDPDRGSFATYAAPYIRGAVLNLLSARGGELHLNSYQARSKERVRAQTARLAGAGMPATQAAVAQELGQTEEWVRRYSSYQRHIPLNPKDQLTIQIPDNTTQERIDAVGTTPISRYLSLLPAQERTALELVHGFSGQRRSITEVGRVMGVPRETAQRYVTSGHTHLGELLGRFERQLAEGQSVTRGVRSMPPREPSAGRPVAPRRASQRRAV